MRRSRALAVVGIAAALVLAGCGDDDNGGTVSEIGGSGSGSASGSASASASGSASAPAEGDEKPAFTKADANTVVVVKALDYKFEFDKSTIAGKKVFFEVVNGGAEPHEFEILGPDGKAVDEIGEFAPNLTKTLAVELAPGTYTAQCILKDKNGKEHTELGMKSTFTVT